MSFAFDRPIGAPADVTELDYVSALMQTDVEGGIRKDGSIEGALNQIRTPANTASLEWQSCWTLPFLTQHLLLVLLISLIDSDISLFLSSRYGTLNEPVKRTRKPACSLLEPRL